QAASAGEAGSARGGPGGAEPGGPAGSEAAAPAAGAEVLEVALIILEPDRVAGHRDAPLEALDGLLVGGGLGLQLPQGVVEVHLRAEEVEVVDGRGGSPAQQVQVGADAGP